MKNEIFCDFRRFPLVLKAPRHHECQESPKMWIFVVFQALKGPYDHENLRFRPSAISEICEFRSAKLPTPEAATGKVNIDQCCDTL